MFLMTYRIEYPNTQIFTSSATNGGKTSGANISIIDRTIVL